jgi:hypothetical protein
MWAGHWKCLLEERVIGKIREGRTQSIDITIRTLDFKFSKMANIRRVYIT